MKDEEFASDTKINFRITGYRKKLVKERAEELKKPVSAYIRDLINLDLSKDETNNIK